MLSEKDLDEIEKLIDSKLKERLKGLPTKEEFYKAMDQIMGELQKMRETYEILAPKAANHEDRITHLEKITGSVNQN